MKRQGWVVVLGVVSLLALGGAALAEENGGSGTTTDSVYATGGVTTSGGTTPATTDGATTEGAATDGGAQPAGEPENTLEIPAVIDAVYAEPCERTVGGVSLRVPACDRVTRHAILPVTFPDLPAGTVVNILISRPAWGRLSPSPLPRPQPQSKGYLVRGDGNMQEIGLELFPGVNVITVSVNNDVQRFRVIRGGGQKLRAFRDVAKNRHWSREHVDKLAANGVFEGYLEGDNFDADRPATRGDVAAFLDRIVNVDPADEPAGDVPSDSRRHKAAKAIQRMMRQGLMKGVGGGRFAPDEPLTRAQVATLLDRALPPVRVDVNIDVEFKDGRKVPDWARESMARMRARGLISGYEDGTVRPDRPLTRAELAAMLSRFMDYRNARHDAPQSSIRNTR